MIITVNGRQDASPFYPAAAGAGPVAEQARLTAMAGFEQ